MDEDKDPEQQQVNRQNWYQTAPPVDHTLIYEPFPPQVNWIPDQLLTHNQTQTQTQNQDQSFQDGYAFSAIDADALNVTTSAASEPASTYRQSQPHLHNFSHPVTAAESWHAGAPPTTTSGEWWSQPQPHPAIIETRPYAPLELAVEQINPGYQHIQDSFPYQISSDYTPLYHSALQHFDPNSHSISPTNSSSAASNHAHNASPVGSNGHNWSPVYTSDPQQWVVATNSHAAPSIPASSIDSPAANALTWANYVVADPGAHANYSQSSRKAIASRAAQHGAMRDALKKGVDGAKPKRRGPLKPETRNKVEEMRDMSACWRCRKYKKSCNGPGVCDSCLIPKFKIWPSAIGCRRENLESMVRFLLPVQLEEGLGMLPSTFQRGRTWRIIPQKPLLRIEDHGVSGKMDRWELSKRELVNTRYFGIEYVELANIAMKYQKSLPQPHKCLEAACEVLLATCNWYKCVVNVPDSPLPTATIIQCGTEVRTTTRRAFAMLQQTCLSTKRTDWFPAFLSAILVTCGAVYFMDVVMNIPAVARDFIWHDINNTRMDLRSKSYALVVDLLRASTKGINPLTMDCFDVPSPVKLSKKAERIRAKEREVLLGGDEAALRGLLELKRWQAKYQEHLTAGKEMFVNDLVGQAKIKPIAGVWKVFEMS